MTTPIAVDSDGRAERATDVAVIDGTVEAPERVAGVVSERRDPIIVDWARTADGRRAWVAWHTRRTAHVTAFHAFRVPLYGWRAGTRVPRGIRRGVAQAYRWVTDADGRHVIAGVTEARDPVEYRKLVDQHDARVDRRRVAAAAAAAVVTGVAVLVATSGSVALQAIGIVTAVGLLAKLGEDLDKPIVRSAVTPTRVEKLTQPVVSRALCAAMRTIKPEDLGFPDDIQRDGPGWRAHVDLPHGVTATQLMAKREELASGLRRPAGAVWPETDPLQHAGRLVLWVGDQAFAEARQRPWPLLHTGDVDLFKPVPFGADQRHRPVRVPLMYSNVLIGALPGGGKTLALRVLGLACALDRRAELHVHEFKGSGDLESLELVAHSYGSGVDDHTIEGGFAALEYALAECHRRSDVISGLPRREAPENKVTSALADRRELGLHPLVVIIDECHELFEHPEFGKRAGAIATKVIKQGRAFGVILMLATQRPDSDSLPTGVSGNVGIRLCMRVMGWQENDMILGTSMHKNGVRATMFAPEDTGIGWLVGASRTPRIVRSSYVDGVAAMRVARRARALRDGAGLLTGMAAGDEPDRHTPRGQLLEDVLAVVPATEDRVWSETVCARLADAWPDRYDGWRPPQLAAALKPFAVTTSQVYRTVEGEGVNRRGITRDDIVDALARVRR